MNNTLKTQVNENSVQPVIKLAREYTFAPTTLITEFCKIASMDRSIGDVEEMLSHLEHNFVSKQGEATDESSGKAAE